MALHAVAHDTHAQTLKQSDAPRTHKTRNRAFGTGLTPRVARMEAYVEAIIALHGCADLERRAGTTIAYNERTRSQLDAQFERGEISFETFHRQMFALDKIETRLAVALIKNAANLRRSVLPEVQREYQQAEAAA